MKNKCDPGKQAISIQGIQILRRWLVSALGRKTAPLFLVALVRSLSFSFAFMPLDIICMNAYNQSRVKAASRKRRSSG
jgi:hypothetical protein